MRFSEWLLLESNNAHSWLSPRGEFFPVKNSHSEDARNLCATYLKIPISQNPLQTLMQNRWMRINFLGPHLLVNNSFVAPNKQQKMALEQLAMTKNFQQIEFDNDSTLRIIWTRPDL